MHEISIISIIFTAALALICLMIVIIPFFKWDTYLQNSVKNQDLATTKEALLITLNEIEFEYKMDKISTADYTHLKKQYENEVASIMKEEQMMETTVDQDLMAEVEKEIEAQMKSYKNKKGEEM